MKRKDWFKVDAEGLAQLQAGRPKWHVVRELVQNAFDENVTRVELTINGANGKVNVAVEDDSPEGFRDLADAFTLFGTTYKRSDPTKRGRFNLGEKQAIAQADYAVIQTTKGGVAFERDGTRTTLRSKRQAGSRVELEFKANAEQRQEMAEKAYKFVAPENVRYSVNGCIAEAPKVKLAFESNPLKTVQLVDGEMKDAWRATQVKLYEPNGDGAWLFELGIPVCKIACKWSLDVQQKVPLAMDRETVPESYLSDLYAQVLNQTVADIQPAEAAEGWVRLGAGHFEVKPETTRALVQKRFGDKVAVAVPGAGRENDEAVANGYRVLHGAELTSEEWTELRKADAVKTTKDLFGLTPGNAEQVTPTEAMCKVSLLAQRIAKRLDGYDLTVQFIKLPNSAGAAWFGDRTLKFVVDRLPADFFDDPLAPQVIDLIIHELGHEHGHHTDRNYLDALTRFGGELTRLALDEPEFFKGGVL